MSTFIFQINCKIYNFFDRKKRKSFIIFLLKRRFSFYSIFLNILAVALSFSHQYKSRIYLFQQYCAEITTESSCSLVFSTNINMDFPSIINRIYIFVSCLDCTIAFAFLVLAFVYRRQCFNFPTLLACNTAVAVFFCSANHIAIGVYMFIWDQYVTPNIDSLCAFRAYFHHSTVACVHHSFILIAIERYCKIRQIAFFKNHRRKICFVLVQWIFDFTFDLPAFITGNMVKFASDNLCFVTLTNFDFVLYMAGLSFLLTDVILSIIYRLLIRHVRQASARLNNNQKMRMQRDLTMVRRIVLLNSQLAVAGIPVLVLIIITIIRADLLPNKTMRLLVLMSNLPFAPMLIILLYLTPDLRQSVIECQNKLKLCRPTRITPVQTITPPVNF